jgi:hypothetical protein
VSQSRRTLRSGKKCGSNLVASGIVTIRSLEAEEEISLTLYHPPEKVNWRVSRKTFHVAEVNLSTTRPEGRDLLEVHPEPRAVERVKSQSKKEDFISTVSDV